MLREPRDRICRKLPFFTVVCFAAVCLAGCSGKKFGFPSFGAKQASSTQEENSAKEKAAAEKTVSELNHVASNRSAVDPAFISGKSGNQILPASASSQQKALDSAFKGTAEINELANAFEEQKKLPLDQAFQGLIGSESKTESEKSTKELTEYKKITTQVNSGASSLGALKASLDALNQNKSIPASDSEVQDDSFAKYVSNQKQDLPVILQELPAAEVTEKIAELSAPKANKLTDISLEFPWMKTVAAAPEQQAGNLEEQAEKNGYGLNNIRGMLTKARGLIQDNNLLDARLIAETASRLKEKTQAAFTPDEVTPEQILAEIAERERVRKEKLLAGFQPSIYQQQSGPKEIAGEIQQVKNNLPVVIDLSKEWLNSTKINNANGVDDIQRFEKSIERANRGAMLPVISPGFQYQNPELTSEPQEQIQTTSYDSKNIASSKREDNSWLHSQPVDAEPAENSNGHESLALPEIASEDSSYLSLNLPPVDDAVGDTSQALMLLPAGVEEVGQHDAGYDEFAADFAGMSLEGAPEIEEAPLLIDEAELSVQATDSLPISTTMLTMCICGFAIVSFMLVRWRR